MKAVLKIRIRWIRKILATWREGELFLMIGGGKLDIKASLFILFYTFYPNIHSYSYFFLIQQEKKNFKNLQLWRKTWFSKGGEGKVFQENIQPCLKFIPVCLELLLLQQRFLSWMLPILLLRDPSSQNFRIDKIWMNECAKIMCKI